ncbi:hypothetical protein MesoLjLc_50550 [Mesorhizobium sp. L-8-10]|uniref:spike base protein, RCAP_Rcc01079 family n=1 Tax=Mesorhizobium sp. L-8-10 TaxID=2744523 RepID=UPI0019292ADA|nr:hypothetical protein [Mesorhizobium sp. L-8-10]BCH33125.1 hypothetical protein MesoLjLc_50550 [Mesorhizobium sp. L-8-10]
MAAVDPWDKTPDEQTFGRAGATITPNDNEDLETVSKGLYVLAEGTVAYIPANNEGNSGAAILTTGSLTAGSVIPYFVRRVMSTGTSATVASIDK